MILCQESSLNCTGAIVTFSETLYSVSRKAGYSKEHERYLTGGPNILWLFTEFALVNVQIH